VKLWFDEDLSPTLVRVANEHGVEATCNRDRGALGHKDAQLRAPDCSSSLPAMVAPAKRN
jgi:predicted nuclease of predicted toxin-antitoxin system